VGLQVTIEAGSKADAALIAARLPGRPQPIAWRGYGVIRLRVAKVREADELMSVVSACIERHGLRWARVRVGDAERMFGRR
jgi:hypothetical protein